MNIALALHKQTLTAPQPNELDRKRIQRALKKRVRYRYVNPDIIEITNGYLINSRCCSRNVDPQGGVIDIARIEFVQEQNIWRLYRKEHSRQQWLLYAEYAELSPILELLRNDPNRNFWQ